MDELRELSETYQAIRSLRSEDLRDITSTQAQFDRRDACFVGSGGAIAMAQLASSVHTLRSAHVSLAMTPLSLAMGRGQHLSDVAVGLFSARARHPDVRIAARAVRARPGNHVVLLTQLRAQDVSPAIASVVDGVVTLPLTTKDGFLATNSLLAMAAAWLAAAGFKLPEKLPMLEQGLPQWPEDANRALVLFGPDQLAAALDLEARLSETGLLDVQLSDLRNMAHGRHVGLLGRATSTAVIALGDPGTQPLLDKTIDLLPTSIRIVDLSTRVEGPVGTLDALAGCMRLVGEVGAAHRFDPGQPRVDPVGRKLYHLPWSRLAGGPDGTRPARMKAMAAGMADSDRADLCAWTKASDAWMASVAGRRVRAVVLDYDGTCVHTHRRTSPPPAAVQAEIVRILEHGVIVAVASGRGPSVIKDLRQWVPQEHWATLVVGIYNGGVINRLASTFEHGTIATGHLATAAELLSGRLGEGWEVESRRWQVTVRRTSAAVADAAALVAAVLAAGLNSPLKVVASGHSVDIVPDVTSKRAVVDFLGIDPDEVLMIGDQGDVGGNDFELLSYSDLTLSVDRVSADGSRCWNLSEDGASGPALLSSYLRAIRARGQASRFVWRPSERGRVK